MMRVILTVSGSPSGSLSPPIAIGTNLWFGGQSSAGDGVAAEQTGARLMTIGQRKLSVPVRPSESFAVTVTSEPIGSSVTGVPVTITDAVLGPVAVAAPAVSPAGSPVTDTDIGSPSASVTTIATDTNVLIIVGATLGSVTIGA